MNGIFVVISSIMSEEATFLVKSHLTCWTTVDPSIMETFLVKFQVFTAGSSEVTDITAVEGASASVFCPNVFLQFVPLLGPELTVSDGARVHHGCGHPGSLVSSGSGNFSNHCGHLCLQDLSGLNF